LKFAFSNFARFTVRITLIVIGAAALAQGQSAGSVQQGTSEGNKQRIGTPEEAKSILELEYTNASDMGMKMIRQISVPNPLPDGQRHQRAFLGEEGERGSSGCLRAREVDVLLCAQIRHGDKIPYQVSLDDTHIQGNNTSGNEIFEASGVNGIADLIEGSVHFTAGQSHVNETLDVSRSEGVYGNSQALTSMLLLPADRIARIVFDSDVVRITADRTNGKDAVFTFDTISFHEWEWARFAKNRDVEEKREDAVNPYYRFDPYKQVRLGMTVQAVRAALQGVAFGTNIISIDDGSPRPGENSLLCKNDESTPGLVHCFSDLYRNPLSTNLTMQFYRNHLFHLMGGCYKSDYKCSKLDDRLTRQTGSKPLAGCGIFRTPLYIRYDQRMSWHSGGTFICLTDSEDMMRRVEEYDRQLAPSTPHQ